MSNTERVRMLRKRKAEAGMVELRDVWVPADRLAEAKAMVRGWAALLKPKA